MPNWCYTDYVVEGSHEDLKCIDRAICDVIDGKFPKQERSAQDWVGNVLHALRIPTEDKDGKSLGYFRAFIWSRPIWIDDNALKFHTHEAWGRTQFAEALRIRFKEITVYWSLQEEFCQVLATNDDEGKYFNERFYVDAIVGGVCHSNYFFCKEDAYNFVREISGCVYDEDVARFNNEHSDTDEYIYIFEYDIVDDWIDFSDDIQLMGEIDTNLF